MARKTEMEKLVQTVNDPLAWFQTATPLTGVVEFQSVGHSAIDDELEEKDTAGNGTDEENASDDEGPTNAASQPTSKRNKR